METGSQKQISARKLSILLLLSVVDSSGKTAQPIMGTTRMQKIVFLISQKSHLALKDSTYFRFDFNYEPEKFGPADLDLYQDLDFLRSMRLITWANSQTVEPSEEPQIDSIVGPKVTKTPALLPEEREEDELSFHYLLGFEPTELLAADAETDGERQYSITNDGLQLLHKLSSESKGSQKEDFNTLEKACREVRQEFGDWGLKRLLKHVYDNYPTLTTKSTILHRVKGIR